VEEDASSVSGSDFAPEISVAVRSLACSFLIAMAEQMIFLRLHDPPIMESTAVSPKLGYYRMRRFTRLTNAFSKKLENLEHNAALYFMHYNFCRIRQTLRVTPAMKAGIADHVWTMAEIVALLP
jgi:hypothetical protein